MRILEAEVDLREETRSTEKAREAIRGDEYAERAEKLSDKQTELGERMLDVLTKTEELPNADNFKKEIALFKQVTLLMVEARDILGEPDTGSRAIACETEVIEALLAARRMKPPQGGGGGGGSSPGGGGNGTTNQAALALLGPGVDKEAKIDERGVSQNTGKEGKTLPAEFREGIEKFREALENGAK